jgi:hypothetical protein
VLDVFLLHVTVMPGDVVVIKSGDNMPADLRLLECSNLQVRGMAFSRGSYLCNLLRSSLNTCSV